MALPQLEPWKQAKVNKSFEIKKNKSSQKIVDQMQTEQISIRGPNIASLNSQNSKSMNKPEQSTPSSVHILGIHPDSTPSSVGDAGAVQSKNIIIPDEETPGGGPLRRRQVRPKTGKLSALPFTKSSGNSDEPDQPKTIGPRVAEVIVPAGPDALPTLRLMIAGYLLSRLPGYQSLEFSTHTKRLSHALLRLRLCEYGQQDMLKWGNPVYAYLRPSPSPSIGPDLRMEAESAYRAGGFNLVEIDWKNDIQTSRVKLHPAFRETNSRQQLYAAIKYYFLLATERAHDDVEHHYIPVNQTFATHLEAVCMAWGTRASPTDDPPEAWEYVDEYASPQYPSAKHDQRRRRDLSEPPGVAKVARESSKDPDLEAKKENDNDIGKQMSSHPRSPDEIISDVPVPRDISSQVNEGFTIPRENSHKLFHGGREVVSDESKRSSRHDKASSSETMHKLKSSSSTPLNPLGSRRPPSNPTDTANSISLKKQRKTAFGRVEKSRRVSRDSSEGSVAGAPWERRISNREISRRLVRLEAIFEEYKKKHDRHCQWCELSEGSDV